MASIGTGYDLSASTYSPVGRIFQVEYAYKAVENAGTAIALRCKDGIVFAVEKIIISKMLEPASNRRLHSIDRHIGMAIAGLLPDGRQLVNRARKEAHSYRDNYDDSIPVRVLNDRLAGFVQAYTLYASMRPFGVCALVGGVDRTGPRLFMVEPSGISWGYLGCAAGKAAAAAKTEIEKLDLKNMTCRQALEHAALIIYTVHDPLKDRLFQLEMSWICSEFKNEHQMVPEALVAAAEEKAKKAQEEEEESGDEMHE